jgi:hypothetical protein
VKKENADWLSGLEKKQKKNKREFYLQPVATAARAAAGLAKVNKR